MPHSRSTGTRGIIWCVRTWRILKVIRPWVRVFGDSILKSVCNDHFAVRQTVRWAWPGKCYLRRHAGALMPGYRARLGRSIKKQSAPASFCIACLDLGFVQGFVSRASPVQTAVRNCTKDEGGPFGFGDQVADPKPPQAAVVKSHGGERCGNAGTMIPAGTVERGERKRTVSEVSKAD